MNDYMQACVSVHEQEACEEQVWICYEQKTKGHAMVKEHMDIP